MVEVVNVKTAVPKFGTLEGDVYIGRYNRAGYPQSKWHNPFHMASEYQRDKVIDDYEKYLFESGLINDICQLKDAKRLGCWCKPKRCHGDVLKKYILQMCGGKQSVLQLRKTRKKPVKSKRCKCK